MLDCAVFGVPDEEFGEKVHAAIRLHEGRSATKEELDAFCKKNIADYKRPRVYTFHEDDFPRDQVN